MSFDVYFIVVCISVFFMFIGALYKNYFSMIPVVLVVLYFPFVDTDTYTDVGNIDSDKCNVNAANINSDYMIKGEWSGD